MALRLFDIVKFLECSASSKFSALQALVCSQRSALFRVWLSFILRSTSKSSHFNMSVNSGPEGEALARLQLIAMSRSWIDNSREPSFREGESTDVPDQVSPIRKIQHKQSRVHSREEMQNQLEATDQPSQPSHGRQSSPAPTPTRTSDPHLAQDEPDSDANTDGMDSDSGPIMRKRRGPARGLKIASLPPGQRVDIFVNDHGQPCNDETSQLMTWIGTLACASSNLPCNYTDWRKIPMEKKDDAWKKIKENFDLTDDTKAWALQKLNDRWRDFKFDLKAKIYNRYTTYEERVLNRDKRVPLEQWLDLLHLWDTDSFQAMCTRNKDNRSKLKMGHTAGKRSFAQIRERKHKENPDGVPPSRLEFFMETHTRKDGSPVDSTSQEKMKRMSDKLKEKPEEEQRDMAVHEEIFSDEMGDDIHGRERLAGVVIRPKGTSNKKIVVFIQENAELRSEVRDLKERLAKQGEEISSMRSDFNELMQFVRGNTSASMQSTEASNHGDGPSQL
ncbi:uncharacterized protein LOC122672327 [Telopea speciosissima]|uniref:uncharacterized protein LOC122672327 n=1 Tax=Telopea speciosissima TaxID=54955 RepID=UPI001CC68614|nr:uncharacterized protein LOC122672327 [Telopea speciosissima]